jgi:ribosome-associated protein
MAKVVSQKARQLAIKCAKICDEKKAENIVILNLTKQNFITDYFVICTTDNPRQARAIAGELTTMLKEKDVRPVATEGESEGRWIVQNFGDVWVHIFDKDLRDYYDLEGLWGDVPKVRWRKRRKR